MDKIGIFYAPEGGSVEKVAQKILQKIGTDKCEFISVQQGTDSLLPKFQSFNKLILGISTVGRDNWDNQYKKVGWDNLIPLLEKISFTGKTVAIVGLGNHLLYPDNFVDSMGILGNQIIKLGAKIVGQVSTENYQFENSTAIVDNNFIGLPIDEDNDSDLTDERINKWLNQIKPEFGF